MSNGPDPALVSDWFTWGGVLFVAACVALYWVTAYLFTNKPLPPAAVSYPVSPCAPRGHHYRAQAVTWRCAHCGDTRVAEGVYDQNAA